MLRSFRLGRAFGIPLYVHSTFLLMPTLFIAMNWAGGLRTVIFSMAVLIAVFTCVVLHELGHALMGRFFGIRTRDITLYPIGGVARMESTGHRPHQEVAIALAGPAVNLAILLLLAPLVAVVALSGLPLNPDAALARGPLVAAGSLVAVVWAANVALVLFNLLPVFPMDGGRVLRATLSVGLGTLRATEVSAGLALVLGVMLSVVGFLIGSPSLGLVPIFVIVVGQLELHGLRQREAARRLESVSVVQPDEVTPSPLTGFTGFVWDQDGQAWVRWVNGRPVAVR